MPHAAASLAIVCDVAAAVSVRKAINTAADSNPSSNAGRVQAGCGPRAAEWRAHEFGAKLRSWPTAGRSEAPAVARRTTGEFAELAPKPLSPNKIMNQIHSDLRVTPGVRSVRFRLATVSP